MDQQTPMQGILNPQSQALREIADKRMKRNDVARTYSYALRQGETDRIVEVNQAIVGRWGFASLRYIKHRAERLVDAR